MIAFSDFGAGKMPLHFFEEISKFPRCSGNSAPIADYLVHFAVQRGLAYHRDTHNNVIIKKPASEGYESRPTVILQGHTDMVMAKNDECSVDMDKEGLLLFRNGDMLGALGTTLGADNGIAVAYMLALLDDKSAHHPNLEAVFTSDEEIGLLGAGEINPDWLAGRIMINMDSDREGIFTAGCAGGVRVDLTLPLVRDIEGGVFYKLEIGGLRGGHSGTEINSGRENAIKILADALSKIPNLRICKICGGNADNAIPRSAYCVFTSSVKRTGELLSIAADAIDPHKKNEEGIYFEITPLTSATLPFTEDSSSKIVRLINEVPSGVINMSRDIEGLVETSLNQGIISASDNTACLTVSVRSSKNEERDKLVKRLRSIAERFSASCQQSGEYPAWEYKRDSHIRRVMCEIYEKKYGRPPEITVIHAGLECGIFAKKLPGLDCISIGPDIFDIHTTEERLSLSSAERVWIFLLDVLKNI